MFEHIIRYLNCTNFAVKELKVSTYLAAEVSKDHQALLITSILDTITGFIIKYLHGEGAKKRILHCQLNLLNCTINLHCCVWNSSKSCSLINRPRRLLYRLSEYNTNRRNSLFEWGTKTHIAKQGNKITLLIITTKTQIYEIER